jgi:type II secretory pathway component PulF
MRAATISTQSTDLKPGRLDSKLRSLLFVQLAQTGKAGLPLRNTLSILEEKAGKSARAGFSEFQREIAAGSDVAQAGLTSGIFLPWEFRLLRAAESSGKLPESYADLSRRYANRARRMSKLKNGLSFPITIFVLMVLLAPLKALYFGEISVVAYLTRTMGSLVLLFGGLYLLSNGWTRLGATGSENTLHRVLLQIPLAGGLIRLQQRRDFLDSLGMLMDSGVPAIEALQQAAESISHPQLRREFASASALCSAGMSVTRALETCGALQNSAAASLLESGEFSGRLVEMIQHQVKALDEQLDMDFKLISDWLPRVIYFSGIILLLL